MALKWIFTGNFPYMTHEEEDVRRILLCWKNACQGILREARSEDLSIPNICIPWMLTQLPMPHRRQLVDVDLFVSGRTFFEHMRTLINLHRYLGHKGRYCMIPLELKRHFIKSAKEFARQVILFRHVKGRTLEIITAYLLRETPNARRNSWVGRQEREHYLDIRATHYVLHGESLSYTSISQLVD